MTLFEYPAYDSFVDSVRLEAEQNVRRLRHHPSLVIWGLYPLLDLRHHLLTVHIFQLGTTKVLFGGVTSF